MERFQFPLQVIFIRHGLQEMSTRPVKNLRNSSTLFKTN